MVAGSATAVLAASVIRQALAPMAIFYLVLMSMLGAGLLRRYRRAPARPAAVPGGPQARSAASAAGPRDWAGLARRVVITAIGGYLLLLAVDVAYYYGVNRVGGAFLSSAVTGPALLIGLALPVFAAASWAYETARARRAKPRGNGPGAADDR